MPLGVQCTSWGGGAILSYDRACSPSIYSPTLLGTSVLLCLRVPWKKINIGNTSVVLRFQHASVNRCTRILCRCLPFLYSQTNMYYKISPYSSVLSLSVVSLAGDGGEYFFFLFGLKFSFVGRKKSNGKR